MAQKSEVSALETFVQICHLIWKPLDLQAMFFAVQVTSRIVALNREAASHYGASLGIIDSLRGPWELNIFISVINFTIIMLNLNN